MPLIPNLRRHDAASIKRDMEAMRQSKKHKKRAQETAIAKEFMSINVITSQYLICTGLYTFVQLRKDIGQVVPATYIRKC